MSSLHALQCELADAMRNPAQPLSNALCGDALASRAQRLAIYQHGYRLRLRDALSTEFPGLALLAGRRFTRLLDAYITAQPSTHFNIRWHGREMAPFLANTPPWRERVDWAEMASLDWAISTAFDAADESPLEASALAGVDAEGWASLRLTPLAHASLLTCTSNIDDFRRAADRGQSRPALRRFARPRHMLVWRPATEVRYRRVDADEWLALGAMWQGECMAQVCERLAARYGPTQALPRLASLLQRWLADGLIGGLSVGVNGPR